jgi:hypothetical protein
MNKVINPNAGLAIFLTFADKTLKPMTIPPPKSLQWQQFAQF